MLPALIRKFHLAKLAMNGDWAGLISDEERFGPIPEPLRKELFITTENPGSRSGTGCERTENRYSSSRFPHHPSLNLSHCSQLTAHSSLVSIWGTGTPRREFLHVDDLADACVFLMRNHDSEEIVNVGAGEDLTIRELAAIVREAVGFSGDISYDSMKPDGTPRKLLDVSRLHSRGWGARIGLPEGIRRTYEWYLEQ